MVRPARVGITVRSLAAAALATAAAGCTEPDLFSGDPFPVDFVSRAGAVTLAVSADGEAPRAAVVDVMSPFTVLDNGVDTEPARRFVALDLIGTVAAGPTVRRARFTGTVLEYHPCDGEPTCAVGDAAAPFPVAAVVGTDFLFGDAIRFDFAASQLYVLPDIAGSSSDRTELCDAVFPRPFQGAGTLVLQGAEVAFTSRRTVIEACLGPDPDELAPAMRGGDALFVLSTAIGTNLLTESAYLRYADATTDEPLELAALPEVTVRLLAGTVTGRLAFVPTIALTATAPQDPRGACREVYASHYLETASELTVCPAGVDCPCEPGDRSCSAPAVVELGPRGGVAVVVIPDEDPQLQALRAELRPLVGEIDGVLGTNVLADLEVDLDYPHDRLLARCTTTAGCVVRPEIEGFVHQPDLVACLASPAVTRR
jgi:hypothetical protein